MFNKSGEYRQKGVSAVRPGLWIKRGVVILAAGVLVAAGISAAKSLAGKSRSVPERLLATRIAADAVLVPGSPGVLAFSRDTDGIRVSRVPLTEGGSAAGAGSDSTMVCADGVICLGEDAVSVTDRATGSIKNYPLDSTGVAPSWTIKVPGAAMAVADKKGVLVITAPGAGKTGFRVKRLDTRGRVTWERESSSGIPLSLRGAPGGFFVAGVLQVKEYPATSLLIVNDSGWAETKPIPGLVRCVAGGSGLLAAGSGSSLYTHDLNGQIKWCVEPGGIPTDVAVCPGGVVVAVRKSGGNGFADLFVRDFVAMYDVGGARLWKADLKPGVTAVRCYDKGVIAGTSAGVVALDYRGKVLWEVDLPSPVSRLEIAPGGGMFYVSTEAGELRSYRVISD